MVDQPLIKRCGCKNYICKECNNLYSKKSNNKCLFNCNKENDEIEDIFNDLIYYVYYNGIDL